MRIITVARQFGSGGREVGKRLADLLGFDYYDREIISAVADRESMSEDYVRHMLEERDFTAIALTFHNSFAVQSVMNEPQTKLLSVQCEVLKAIAARGRDCIIVGRNADVILKEYKPFRIFVCARQEARIARCRAREDGQQLSLGAIRRNVRRIDKNRAKSREFLADGRWGEPTAYDLVINTTEGDFKGLTKAAAAFFCSLTQED